MVQTIERPAPAKAKPLPAASNVARTRAIVINAPQLFARPEFIGWALKADVPVASVSAKAACNAHSEVVVRIDDFSRNSLDMPEQIWSWMQDCIRHHLGEGAALVYLTNLD